MNDSYLKLVLAFPLVVIKSEEQFQEGVKIMDGLLVKGILDEGEEEYLDRLSDLIADYEDQHYAI